MSEPHAVVSKSQSDPTPSLMVSEPRLKTSAKAGSSEPEPQAILQQLRPAALHITEILLIIFQYLDSPTLVCSAQVCKFWSGVALDILWKDLPTYFPLLKLYGLRFSGTRYYGDRYSAEWGFGTSGPHTPTKRQHMYPLLVRSLFVRPNNRTHVRMRTLCQLSRIKFHLPNLETLHFKICGNSDDDFLGAIPFIMPTLKSLTLALLSKIPESDLPRLRQLFDSIYNTPGLSLEYLDVFGIILTHPVAIEALGRLVRQQTSLRHLEVQLSNTELFASACVKSDGHPSITSLKIRRPNRVLLPTDNLDFVRPLFQFAGLKAISLGTLLTPTEIRKEDIIAMASAWPTLQQLRLQGFWAAPALLLSIALLFPWLDALDISLYWSNDPGHDVWPQITDDSIPRLTQLRELYLRPYPGKHFRGTPYPLEMSEARTLSRLILAICPNGLELLLPPLGSQPEKGPYIRWPCTSLDVVEPAILKVFQEAAFQRLEEIMSADLRASHVYFPRLFHYSVLT